MARIPVEKKGGTPWWLWLLGLLLLVGLIWLVAGLLDNDPEGVEVVDVDPVETYEEPSNVTPAATTGMITSIATILDAEDKTALAGRQVQLSNLRVTEVIGDSTFYVTPENAPTDRRLFVALDEVIPAPPESVEGRYDVTQGQVVTLHGTLRALQRTDPGVWGITSQEAQRMMDDEIYLRAQRLEITSRPN